MSPKRVPVLIAGLAALLMQGCAATPTVSTQAPQTDTAPGINIEAQQALERAEADINLAREKFALWTTADAALKAAQKAARSGDSNAVINHAGSASAQARLGLAQLDYASTEPE